MRRSQRTKRSQLLLLSCESGLGDKPRTCPQPSTARRSRALSSASHALELQRRARESAKRPDEDDVEAG